MPRYSQLSQSSAQDESSSQLNQDHHMNSPVHRSSPLHQTQSISYHKLAKVEETHSNQHNSIPWIIWIWSNFRFGIIHIKNSFSSLKGSPKELYINFFLKFCESYGYFALSQILVIYLHNEFDVSDVEAGTAYGLWGAAITFWGFIISCINDKLGVRKSLLIGFAVSGLSSLIIALAQSKYVIYGVLFFLFPIGNCTGIPMLTVGIKRCTNDKNRGFAFGLFYSVMNIAALASGPVVDMCNIVIAGSNSSKFFTGNRLVIFTIVINYIISWIVTYWYLDETNLQAQVRLEPLTQQNASDIRTDMLIQTVTNPYVVLDREEEEEITLYLSSETIHSAKESIERLEDSQEGFEALEFNEEFLGNEFESSHGLVTPSSQASSSSPSHRIDRREPQPTSNLIYDLCTSLTFWRFCVLTLFLINLRTIFRHMDATLPTYLIRCFGPNYPKGIIYSINPFMIIWLTPVVAALTSTWPHFDMIKYGGYLSAAAPFFIAFSTTTWAVVMFMIVLSLGEAIWSPRLYDYTMSIAPEGKEATFSSLATVPLFAAKIPVGLLSGYLISKYLPEGEGEKEDGKSLWLIIGLLTLTSPILITIFESCIREPTKVQSLDSQISINNKDIELQVLAKDKMESDITHSISTLEVIINPFLNHSNNSIIRRVHSPDII